MLTSLMEQFETASQSYADQYDIQRDDDWFMLKLLEEVGELTQVWNRRSGRALAKGHSAEELDRMLSDETADLLGHVLLFARRHGLDLEGSIARKWRFHPHL